MNNGRSLLLRTVLLIGAFIFTLSSISGVAFGEDEPKGVLGDWGGLRSRLEQSGITAESVLTLDSVSNVSGGLKRESIFLGNYDLTFSLDTEKANLWSGGTLFAYVLANVGEAPTEIVGDTQATDNIEAPETIKLYEAWYDHSFADGKFSALIGLHDYNSEFDVLNYAGGLINSSFGIQPDISQVGPSIFPTTSLGLRLKYKPCERSYVQGALYDGVPGDPNNDRGTHVDFNSGDGLFYALETGLEGEEGADYFKTAIGFWYLTSDVEDIAGEPTDRNRGFYAIGEKALTTEAADASQGLGAFMQLGFARASVNQIDQYLGVGLAYTGLISGRDEDVLSLGVAYAQNGNDYVETDPSILDAETAVEVNYHYSITPNIAVTPDVQWIVNPGTTQGVDDALVLTVRTEIAM